jgi:DNA-binding NtrC family response regulator
MDIGPNILVVDSDARQLSWTLELLQSADYSATGAASFKAARGLLGSLRYDLLITNLRLQAYNGMHLIFNSHVLRPHMPAIIIDSTPDPANENEARRAGAAYLGGFPDADRLTTLIKTVLEEEAMLLALARKMWVAEPAEPGKTPLTN